MINIFDGLEKVRNIEAEAVSFLRLFRNEFYSGNFEYCKNIASYIYYLAINIDFVLDDVDYFSYAEDSRNSDIVKEILLLEDRVAYYSAIVNLATHAAHKLEEVQKILSDILNLVESGSKNTCKVFYEEMKNIAFSKKEED